jgi:hypothetical protein
MLNGVYGMRKNLVSNRRKLRGRPKGDLKTRAAIKVARRVRQANAIRRKVMLLAANTCRCGRPFAKGFKWCCVACSREQGVHTAHCNKRNTASQYRKEVGKVGA